MLIGYILLVLMFIIFRFFYHILPKKSSRGNLMKAVKKDLFSLYDYAKKIIFFHPRLVKVIIAFIIILFILPLIPIKYGIICIIDDVMNAIMYFLLVIVFAPQEDLSRKEFPIEIFGFTYSVIFMFYSMGVVVFDIFYMNDFFKEDMWIYGYSITLMSYFVCVATLRRFMERDLSREEIVLLGMIMLTTMEFITYYGVGFFSGINGYNPQDFEANIFGDIAKVINQGIFVASQSQILDRNTMEIVGYIVLNGTDVLTVTAVFGYLVQKFIEIR
ncbi:hypothetical protein [Selenomonas sp. AE3005]|uniref:hypothetical protein n=1 Tax=Selenomonas sp. AE3005 TaxID=1485543 RepID=UPI000485F453|nr:hypothetical protein [Selenomonas sp. AE3005]